MRFVALIDMDCFYAQVEQRDAPELWEKPLAVVQYAREGAYGGIIALSYEAKWAGVKRGMFIPEAKAKCPDLQVAFVPQGEHVDKADIQKYRDASAEVFKVLNNVDSRIIVERASVDEAFLDMTRYCEEIYNGVMNKNLFLDKLIAEFSTTFPTSHLADGRDVNSKKSENYNYQREANLKQWLHVNCRVDPIQFKLAIATLTVEKIRADVNSNTQFFCSAGIANNKTLAKLVCARHKPRQQTVLPMAFVHEVYLFTPIQDVRMLGGKLGKSLQFAFNISTMAELANLEYGRLCELFPNQAKWLWNLARGQEDEPVKARDTQTSIAVSKNFPGKNAITSVAEVTRWVDGLSRELAKRLLSDRVKNKRTAENLVVTLWNPTAQTKTLKLHSYNWNIIQKLTWAVVKTFNKATLPSTDWDPPILNLSLSATRFLQGVTADTKSILNWVTESIPLEKPDRNEEGSESTSERSHVQILDMGDVPSSSDERFIEVVENETKPEKPTTDDDGWQIYEPEALEDAPSSSNDGMFELDGELISKEVFDELPDFIKAEIQHDQRLSEARKRFEEEPSRRSSQSTAAKRSKKRVLKAFSATSPPPKKTLDKFFKK